MTYSFKIKIDNEEEVDFDSLSKEDQEMIGQLLFRTMLEKSGRCRGKKILKEIEDVEK